MGEEKKELSKKKIYVCISELPEKISSFQLRRSFFFKSFFPIKKKEKDKIKICKPVQTYELNFT